MIKNENKIIGGEFDIDLDRINRNPKDKEIFCDLYKYSTGRSALYYILRNIKAQYNIHKLLLPDYLCSSIVTAAEKAEMQVRFYELNEQLEIDKRKFTEIYDNSYAILLINYFGIQDISDQIAFIHSINKEAIIVEDDVQAYYEFTKELNGVNYKFTSLRKTFACPDGGLVKTYNNMSIINSDNKFHQYKLAGSILKSLRKPDYFDDDIYLQLFSRGESLINDEIKNGSSWLTGAIMTNINIDRVSEIRKKNTLYMISGLKSLGIKPILPISETKTPLFLPIYIQDRDKIRKYLFKHNVFCPIHWPTDEMNVKKGKEMEAHELSLIIDQRYKTKDMEFILNLISDNIR